MYWAFSLTVNMCSYWQEQRRSKSYKRKCNQVSECDNWIPPFLFNQEVSSLKTQWGIVRNDGTCSLGSHHCPCSLWTGSSWKSLITAGRAKKKLAYNEVADGIIRYGLGCPIISLPSSFFYPLSSRFFFLLLFETSWYKIGDTLWLLIGASTNVCVAEAISGCLSRLFKLCYYMTS